MRDDVALKTNILSDAFMNINAASVELAPRWTLDVSGGLNAWTLSRSSVETLGRCNLKLVIGSVGGFAGHFIGIHVHGGQYNLTGKCVQIAWVLIFSKKIPGYSKVGFLGGGIATVILWILGAIGILKQ